MKKSVDEVLDDQSLSYFEQAEKRDKRVGAPRIGTSFTLREDFYSAMFLYYVKTDYLLGTDPNKMDDSMNQFYSDTRSSREIIKGESTKEPLINPSPIASQSRNIIQPSDDDY